MRVQSGEGGSKIFWLVARLWVALTCLLLSDVLTPSLAAQPDADSPLAVNLDPTAWRTDYERFMRSQLVDHTGAGVAFGNKGAVTVAYNGLAARAGLEALKQGGNAMDAALTTAITQVTLTAGAPISYFGILSLVYYDAESQQVVTMNAEWNTVLGEDKAMSIPGGIDMSDPRGIYGRDPSGRTALVGGFMKGVGAAHARFGSVPFEQLFAPAIYVAVQGMPISKKMAGYWSARKADLARLPETKSTMLKPDGSGYSEGDLFRQPALAKTLQKVATLGTDYFYKGEWAQHAVAAIRADGGKMSMEDLAKYEVTWSAPLVAKLGEGVELYTNPPPNGGGVAMIEAQQLARASKLSRAGHWTRSANSLRTALDITQLYVLEFLPSAARNSFYPDVDFSPSSRVTPEHAQRLWQHISKGKRLMQWEEPSPSGPKHSDDVVAIDRWGNIAAITQSINCVLWGKTAIVVDGVTIGDPASFQQTQIARLAPGSRLPAPTETGIVFRNHEPILGFASMGSGLHQKTFQGLLNVLEFGMTVDQAINSADFFMPLPEPGSIRPIVRVPAGRFPKVVLEGTGFAFEEVEHGEERFSGEGIWVAISRNPETGELRAASHNRNNSAAVAY